MMKKRKDKEDDMHSDISIDGSYTPRELAGAMRLLRR